MKLKHLQTFTATVDEAIRNPHLISKQYEDSADFEDAHNQISRLLKQVSRLIQSQQHANWMEETDSNFGEDDEGRTASEIYQELVVNIKRAEEANSDLYDYLTAASER